MPAKILVVDDEAKMRRVLQMMLEENGCQVDLAEGAEKALSRMKEVTFSLIITDMKMPGMSGLQLLKEIKKLDEGIPVVVMTAYGTIPTAIEAMKAGAHDYVLKPFDMEEMKTVVEKALEREKLLRRSQYLQEELEAKYQFDNIVGESSKMKEVFRLISQVAPTKSTVLVSGESGTGKELIARSVHHRSPREDQPFVVVNCAALSENLLESELFGHLKGAFTGAHRDRRGRFTLADGGSIFLDEIGAMSPGLQAKILRVLQEKEFEPVGGTRSIQVDVRIIAATNQDLKMAVEEGSFREDLYYRLNVVPIHLPPLRERKEDIPLLAYHFLRRYSQELTKGVSEISPEALGLMLEYDWPGNIRELENAIERAMVLSKGNTLSVETLPLVSSSQEAEVGDENISYQEAKKAVLESFERRFFTRILKEAGGNVSQAARQAQIDRKNLYQKMKELRLNPKDY
ncbi:sigma-54-dependent Fis family transcriptional regulator [bacterium]|nr:sigma-54-dependent Fis family transcriptional regulator [bacterium]MCK4325650.1 sigma-54-dependent Fis family transcriptional regulator [bacterium]